jgi:hypothetical protein
MASRQENVADGHVAIGCPADDHAAVKFAAGNFLAVGFDDDVGHNDIIEQAGVEGPIFAVERNLAGVIRMIR